MVDCGRCARHTSGTPCVQFPRFFSQRSSVCTANSAQLTVNACNSSSHSTCITRWTLAGRETCCAAADADPLLRRCARYTLSRRLAESQTHSYLVIDRRRCHVLWQRYSAVNPRQSQRLTRTSAIARQRGGGSIYKRKRGPRVGAGDRIFAFQTASGLIQQR